ncbi:MAG: tetratricopeptide repeat protein [Candidatus Omnitrophica bacterium]|nr:tetratricopeptide repeat protein [Candidatus Omnitrophota bacterium]
MDPGQTGMSSSDEVSFSGCISYRPVTAASFFLDYFLWQDKAWGHHSSNIFLHFVVVVLVFFAILALTKRVPLATMTALLFATHPIHSEVVNNIGYRSDLLGAIFYLLSFIAYIHATRAKLKKRRRIFFAISFLSFSLALFAKEFAMTLPLILLSYHWLFVKEKGANTFAAFKIRREASFFIAILMFYLYIYFVAIPSAYYPKFLSMIQPATHGTLILEIFFQYIKVLFSPFSITILPPLYAPPVEPANVGHLLTAILSIVACLILAAKIYKKHALAAFGIIWFFVTYLPASNVMPLPNPFAFRFLYLPSVGFFIAMAVFLEFVINFLQQKTTLPSIGRLLKITCIAFYMFATIPNNEFFKNNLVACKEIIRNYPDSSHPYWILGLTYLDRQEYDKAIVYFKKYQQTNPNNPFIAVPKLKFLTQHMLGRCYVNDHDQATYHFKTAIKMKPDFLVGYFDLAKAYVVKGEYEEALQTARAAIAIDDKLVMGYVYASHSLAAMGRFQEARKYLEQARILAPGDINVKYLQDFIVQKEGQ